MKKFLIYISLVFVFFIMYLLQISIFTSYTIAGVMPNLMIILMLFIGLYMGRSKGIVFGILFGIFIDIWIGRNIGITSVCLALIGFLSGVFDKNFSKDSRLIVIFMGAICTIIFEVLVYISRYFFLNTNIEILQFLKILGIEVIYNILLTTILYPLIRVTGNSIEGEIKGDKIFTRYY